MATLNDFLTSIADAIRYASGESAKINASDFVTKIRELKPSDNGDNSGGGTNTETTFPPTPSQPTTTTPTPTGNQNTTSAP